LKVASCATPSDQNSPKIAQGADKVLGTNDRNLGRRPKGNEKDRTKAMSDAYQAQALLRGAFPSRRYGKLDNVFFEAARFINRHVRKQFTERRARSIWEGTARRIDSEEMEALRLAQIEETRREQRDLRARLAALDEMLANVDAALAGASVAGEGERIRGAGGMDRA
jgi:hypothetical protein